MHYSFGDFMSQILENCTNVRGVAGDLRMFARAFDCTGNTKMAENLNGLADELDVAQEAIRDEYMGNLTKSYQSSKEMVVNICSLGIKLALDKMTPGDEKNAEAARAEQTLNELKTA